MREIDAYEIDGTSLVVSIPIGSAIESRLESLGLLTTAERTVVALAIGGASNATIAKLRRTSDRTIANQLASAFGKLGVHSRAELAARLEVLSAAPEIRSR